MKPLAPMLGLAAVLASASIAAAQTDWPSYNRTLNSDRFSPLRDIDRSNVAKLRVACTYDTGVETAFQTGPIVVGDTLFFTTEKDTYAIDPSTCALRWRVSETYEAVGPLKVNRGAAWLEGRLFRGTEDGRVIAYDSHSGAKLWERQIGDKAKGETTPAALIAWDGKVFIGNAGGDNYAVKGRMYALDAATGSIVWERYLVPKDAEQAKAMGWGNSADVPIAGGATWTSYSLDAERGLLYVPGGNPAPDFAYHLRQGENRYADSIVVIDARTGAVQRHFPLVAHDNHDWDASAAPVLFSSRAGHRMMAAAIKDGHLYGYDLDTGRRAYRTAVTTVANAEAPITAAGTHFCPGAQGGVEWNGPAYDRDTNLVYTGAVDWCAVAKIADDAAIKSVSAGQPWSGNADKAHAFGQFDDPAHWAGWVTATDADTGKPSWRYKTPAPVLAAVTPTAGRLLFTGDMSGKFYAFDAEHGALLWQTDLGGALAGGVITYEAGGKQRVAVAAGMVSPIWPTKASTARIVVLSLP